MQGRTPINYKEHKAIFQNIKEQERSEWTRRMLDTPQLKGKFVQYRQDYPNHGKWNFKGCEHHYYYSLNSQQPSKGIIFYFPGLNAHANGSAYFTMNVAKACPVDIYALDYKNFGRSSGENRGLISSAEQIIQQAEQFVLYILSQQKDKKKVYISGLSMGGAVCFKLAIRHPERYDGVILLSPAIKQNKEVAPFMKKVGKLMGSLFPNLKIMNQTFDSATKYDQTETIMNDPYMYKGKIVPGTIKVVLELMEQIEGEWEKFTSPFLLIQSGVDKMVDPFVGIDFQKQCSSKDKTVIYFKDMWHAIFAQDQMPDVVDATIEWMLPRISQ